MAINGKRVAFLVATEGVEQVELTEPWGVVEKAGGTPRLISTDPGTVQAYHHLNRADTFRVDDVAAETDAAAFDALVLPGGVANGDLLRWQDSARDFVRRFAVTGRPIAVICHGGWILIDTNLASGRRITSWPSLAVDFRNAGARWSDEALVVDTEGPFPLVSSRKPDDLPVFTEELVSQLELA
jgi:protease I